MSSKTYRARAAGWIAGKRVAEGEEIRLTAAQAKYEPVEEAAPVAKRATATAKPARKVKGAAKPAETETAVAPVAPAAPGTDSVATPEPDSA